MFSKHIQISGVDISSERFILSVPNYFLQSFGDWHGSAVLGLSDALQLLSFLLNNDKHKNIFFNPN